MTTTKIPIRVDKAGAANWKDEEVEMERPVNDWTENDLHQLVGKMQWFIGGQQPVATCEPLAGGYRIAVAVEDRKAATMHPLPLSDALAASAVWTGRAIREGETLAARCPDCGGELQANKRFTGWSRTQGEAEMREPVWTTTCLACGHRFNYSPGSGEMRRFEP